MFYTNYLPIRTILVKIKMFKSKINWFFNRRRTIQKLRQQYHRKVANPNHIDENEGDLESGINDGCFDGGSDIISQEDGSVASEVENLRITRSQTNIDYNLMGKFVRKSFPPH